MGKIKKNLEKLQETEFYGLVSNTIIADKASEPEPEPQPELEPVEEADKDFETNAYKFSDSIVRLFYGDSKMAIRELDKLTDMKVRPSVSKEMVNNPSEYNEQYPKFQKEMAALIKKYCV